MPADAPSSVPFARPLPVTDVPPRGLEIDIEASPAEREALAADLGILGVEALRAHFTVTHWRRNGLRVEGRVEGRAVQACVVTLDPVEEAIDEPVEVSFLPAEAIEHTPEELVIDPDAPDEPDPIENGRIDLGALAAEHFALGLDPYPRKPGVAYTPEENETAEDTPFAALARLTKGPEGT